MAENQRSKQEAALDPKVGDQWELNGRAIQVVGREYALLVWLSIRFSDTYVRVGMDMPNFQVLTERAEFMGMREVKHVN